MIFVLSAATALFLVTVAETRDSLAELPSGEAPCTRAIDVAPAALSSAAAPSSAATLPAPQRAGLSLQARPDNVERVQITTPDRIVLQGDFWKPNTRGELTPAVLLVHDAGRDRGQFDDLASQLHRRGLAVLTLDLRGHGRSATEQLNWSTSNEEERRNLWALAARDVQSAATWLRQRSEVHSTNLNLVGIGAGSALAARHATRDENVRSLVLVRPEVDQLGFDLSADLRSLEGLPAFVAAPTEARSQVQGLLGPLDGSSSLQLTLVRNADGPLLDNRTPRAITTWVSDQALPRRGRG